MSMRKILIFFLFLTFTFSAHSQVGGESVYQFLNLVSSPRHAALGGKTIAMYDYDVNQPLFNPATINEEMNKRLAVNYASYFADINYGTASYVHTFKKLKPIHFGVNYINYGTFDGRDELGNQTGSFSGSETAISLGYAYTIPNTKVHIGASAKMISSKLESYSSFGLASDIGLLAVSKSGNVNYALVLRNVGTQLSTYNGLQEKLPFEVLVGISQELEKVPVRWNLTLENLQKWDVAFSNPARTQQTIDGNVEEEKITFLDNAFRHVIFGAEIMPKKAFNIRLSYNFRRSAELKLVEQRSFAGLSLGFGLRFNKFRFDYAYSRYTLAGSTSLFGVMINL